jgi:hypothetical protein
MSNFERELHVFNSKKLVAVVNEAIKFFLQTPIHILPPPERFLGGGVYALYYSGDFKYYTKLSKRNQNSCNLPIYIGKTVPPGWRTARINVSESPDLHRRLGEHARSITQAENLDVDDFRCRFIIFVGIAGDLVVPVEAQLIRKYKPLWNMIIDGFGNHDPGKGRYNQAKSDWDVMHKGRLWADRLTGKATSLKTVVDKTQKYMNSL